MELGGLRCSIVVTVANRWKQIISALLMIELWTLPLFYYTSKYIQLLVFNNSFLRERGMASNPKMEYQVFFCIFQKNLAMATLSGNAD